MRTDWEQLLRIAQAEVLEIIEALPETLRKEVSNLSIIYLPKPAGQPVEADDFDLGVFHGQPLAECADVFLFLENIWTFAEEDLKEYRREVRTTFLHELGHYLGLEEIDLEERGL